MSRRRGLLDRLLLLAAKTHARRQLHRFLHDAHRAEFVQENVRRELVRHHADSAFGREHGFAKIRSHADFIRQIPIHGYDDLRPYVERVMNGDVAAMFPRGERILMFATTSGTTDRPKYVPVTSAFLREYRRGWNAFGLKALLDHPAAVLRPILQVVSPIDEQRTERGVPCGAISGLLAATQKGLVKKYYVLPPEVGRIADPESRYYTIVRLALAQDVAWMITASPATQLKVAKTLGEHTESLLRDLHDGDLRPPNPISPEIRRSLDMRLRADPGRARELQRIAQMNGGLTPATAWNLSLLSNWMGGTMGLHLREFPRYFGDCPVRDIGLLATEGRVCVPLEDGTPAGVLDVRGAFFEFIPADEPGAASSSPQAGRLGTAHRLRCHELTLGAEYRVVMSTWAGLFRYDLGDFVRVRGFLGQAPLVEFLHRGAHVSSMTGEKLTEWQVTTAFDRVRREGSLALDNRVTAADNCSLAVDNFVLAPAWGEPPFYRLYLDEPCTNVDALAVRLDEELSRLNIEYASKRASNRLGPIIVSTLPCGTLARLDSLCQHRLGASNEQFKHKYLLTRPDEDAELSCSSDEAAGVTGGSSTSASGVTGGSSTSASGATGGLPTRGVPPITP